MNFKQWTVAAALGASALGAQAQFTTVDLGALDNVSTPIGAFKSAPGLYFDIYEFLVGAPGTVSAGVVGVPLDVPFTPGVEYDFQIGFIGLADANYVPLQLDVDGSDGFSFQAALPTAGAYKFFVAGFATGSMGGSYGGVLQSVTAVPEPETYAMMLAGLGALGFLARRRRT